MTYATTTQNVYALSPANHTAGRVVSGQRNCARSERLTRQELSRLVTRLQAKRAPLKKDLGIETSRQRKTLMTTVNKHGTSWHPKPESLIEYISLGQSIDRLNRELQQLKKDRKEGLA